MEFIEPPDHPYRISFDGDFSVSRAPAVPKATAPDDRECKKQLEEVIDRLREYQRRLYAENRQALLLVFQAMDAAGKDSTIRAVTSGLNPAGFQVFSFKQPSSEELDHDFLWRTTRRLPERGRIGIFNRSYYEETLIVRVHPEYLDPQRLPAWQDRDGIWERRFESIREHERHLARNGTVIVKFWLNVSRDEQKRRFLDRIEKKKKRWKFSHSDVEERQYWPSYMEAYEDLINATSRPWAPWYGIPADRKPFMRLTVAKILESTFDRMDPRFPKLDPKHDQKLSAAKKQLEGEG